MGGEGEGLPAETAWRVVECSHNCLTCVTWCCIIFVKESYLERTRHGQVTAVQIFLERTREGYHRTDEHWNRFKGNVGETQRDRAESIQAFLSACIPF